MADSHKKQIADTILSLLESRTQLAALVLAGNRNKETREGWLRDRIARAPNDYPRIDLAEGRFSDGAFDTPMTYGMETSGFPGRDADWLIRDKGDFELTITARDTASDVIQQIAEESRNALLLGGTNFGMSFVLRWGPLVTRPRTQNIQGIMRAQRIITIPMELEFHGKSSVITT